MEIEVPNPGFRLKPGMYARVRLTVERRPNALTVPRNAVVDIDGKRGVFMVDEPDVAKFHEVQTGLPDGERIEILDGLSDGQRVVTAGALALRDGDRVSVRRRPERAAAAAADGAGAAAARGRGTRQQTRIGRGQKPRRQLTSVVRQETRRCPSRASRLSVPSRCSCSRQSSCCSARSRCSGCRST